MLLRHRFAVLAAVAALVIGVAPAASASPPEQAQRQHTVATYNLFLGGDIGSLVRPDVDTVPEFIAAAAALWQNVVATDFPARAEAIADLLAEDHPDVVGLQEVAKWETAPLAGGALEPTYDFLAILLDALAERGTPYDVLVTNTNFVSPEVPVPPIGRRIKFTDRDVVIARADLPTSQLQASDPQPHTFAARIPVTLPPGLGSIEIIRGWSSVDVKLRGKTYLFANTHLEAFSPLVRNAQAAELMAALAASPHPVVLVGDLNSQPTDMVGAYGQAKAIGLVDSWLTAPGTGDGDTSGQTDSLRNVPSTIDHRIDYVLYDPDGDPEIDAVEAHVIGEELADRTASGLWPSDHAGVVATLHVGHP